LFFIGKVMDRVCGSQDHDKLSVYGVVMIIGQHSRSGAQEVTVIAWREREEVVGVLTNGATWRRSCGRDHKTALNRGSRWCSEGEMVSNMRRRDWSQGGCSG
jgi:hypothetical protein